MEGLEHSLAIVDLANRVFGRAVASLLGLAGIKVADSPTYAYPVVSGKRVFIKDQDSVALLMVK